MPYSWGHRSCSRPTRGCVLGEENEVGRVAESNYRAPRKAGRGLDLSGSIPGPREDSEHVWAADVCHVDGVTRRPWEAVAGACCTQSDRRPITFPVKLPSPLPVFLPICPLSTSCPALQLNIFIKGKNVLSKAKKHLLLSGLYIHKEPLCC